ncbi:hypothetical protein SDRG_15172 [Saprolegnia diclina VS20]|uniref:CWH43-like N-terminal domain-containing protein n=1 Tax=Saprolegnia diclina (strain VS20) TaxID=1156394 RepID=T0R4P9_SAPDV|nr:hypothetical protein SDRG_15172 [Saprolegnia diclina VS20]EQC27058.1 hypothetical protein SDRG_15172 [Saprolegnia diclina VS20]|eukprot:XP_008619558.1 hypothetical protein SDRG_15172 [Saprolegnia diclina VS20]
MNRARSACSIVATTAVVVTLITCVAIAKSQDIYVGGLAWPFLSDMGRDPPAYYVFVVGLCITAASLLFVWFFNYCYQTSVMAASSSGCHKCLRTFVAVCGMVSAFALPILSICDTARFPSVHNASAYAFFCLEALAVLCNTVLTYRIYKQRGDDERYTMDGLDRHAVARVRRQAWVAQLTVAMLFLAAFILYLPVGLALSCEFEHLTIAKCLDLKLGDTYCTSTMMLNTTSTKLWDYSAPDCTSVHQMRAGAQLACILTLVGYSLTFIFNYQDTKKYIEDDRSAYAVAGP